jgi:hypothetical protein
MVEGLAWKLLEPIRRRVTGCRLVRVETQYFEIYHPMAHPPHPYTAPYFHHTCTCGLYVGRCPPQPLSLSALNCSPPHYRPSVWLRLFFKPNLLPYKYPNIPNSSYTSYIPTFEDWKNREHLNYRCQWITQKKAHNKKKVDPVFQVQIVIVLYISNILPIYVFVLIPSFCGGKELVTHLLIPLVHFITLHPTALNCTCWHCFSSHLNFTQIHIATLPFGLTPFKFPTVAVHLT